VASFGRLDGKKRLRNSASLVSFYWIYSYFILGRYIFLRHLIHSNFGERVLFRCPTDGNFIAYVQNDEIDSEIISNAVQIKPAEEITYVHDSQKFVRMFLILKPDK